MKKFNICLIYLVIFNLCLVGTKQLNAQNCKPDTIYSYSLDHISAGNYEKKPAYKTIITESNNNLSVDYVSQLYVQHLKQYRNYTKIHYDYHPTYKRLSTFQLTQLFDTSTNNWANVNKSEISLNNKGKTLNQSYYNWNKTNQNWRQTSNNTKTYINDTLISTEENQQYVLHLNSLRNYSKYNYTYDSKGNVLTDTYSEWDTVNNNFQAYRRNTFTYNALSQIETELIEYWDKTLNRFVKYSIYENIYTSTNKISIKTYKLWNEGLGIFVNNFREMYLYNANDLVLEELHQNFNTGSSTWIDNYKYDFSYNSQNLLSEKTTNNYNVGSMTWEPYYKETTDYNMSGKSVKEYLLEWLTASSEWREKSLSTYKYNTGDTLINHEYYVRNEAINGLEIYSKKEYEYSNVNPVFIERNFRSYDGTLGYFQNASQNEHLCKMANTNLNSIFNNNNYVIYPNPCKNGFIQITSDKTINYEIYRFDGKTMKIGKILPNETIDVRFLTSGIYIINLDNKSIKLIIE